VKPFKLMFAAVVLVAACGKKDGVGGGGQDSLGRDLSLAPVDSGATLNDAPTTAEAPPPAPEPPPPPPPPARPRPPASSPSPAPAPPPAPEPAPAPPPAPAKRSLESGTTVALKSAEGFTSESHKAGQTITATVSSDVTNGAGKVVIPAGSTVTLKIDELVRSKNKDDSGKVVLKATSVNIEGKTYDLDGTSTEVEHQLKGRGVRAGDAAKVGAGAAAGAIVGRVLSGKKKGAVVGGVIGAAAGTAVAVNSADRDLVVPAGARIVIRLSDDFEVDS